jgi:dipeptidyl-peptidase-3
MMDKIRQKSRYNAFLYPLLVSGIMTFGTALSSCQKADDKQNTTQTQTDSSARETIPDFVREPYTPEQFADLRILQYEVEGFDKLSLNEKKLVYYLVQAGLCGRDIIYDQNYKHNLRIRKVLEAVVKTYSGDKNSENWNKFMVYAKRVWFSNGIHHHYAERKILPEFSKEYFAELLQNSDASKLPLSAGQEVAGLIEMLTPILFDPKIDGKRVNKADGVDLVATSATNFYSADLTQKEVENFYKNFIDPKDTRPISHGLNSLLRKGTPPAGVLVGYEKDGIYELPYAIGTAEKKGKYAEALSKMVEWLKKAAEVAENQEQKRVIELLIEYYQTGDLKKFDEYSIAWTGVVNTTVDFINGFIEVYGDPLGYKASYESVIYIENKEASERMKVISENAQFFEDNSPILPEHKKKEVKGVSYRVITVVGEAGDAAPSTPIGINLPNANWIRKEHGSKSISLMNIEEAYEKAAGEGITNEFYLDEAVKSRLKAHGGLSSKMHTALHEVIGHASGQIEAGVGTPKETLKNYASTLEEARADLVALYYILDPKMVELNLVPSDEVGKAEYDSYIMNGLMLQLRRLELGEHLEEDHMRNRQLVAAWVYEKGKAENVIEKKVVEGKTYFVVNDYAKLRVLFGDLLREIQRVISKGDFVAAKKLVETYGVKVDKTLHKEVLDRYAAFNIAPYSGFIQPTLVPFEKEGQIIDIKIKYGTSFVDQMLEYGDKYSFLPFE